MSLPECTASLSPRNNNYSGLNAYHSIRFPEIYVLMVSGFSCVQLFTTLRTVTLQAPLSGGFPRQEYWSGLPRPPPGDLLDQATEPTSFMSPALAGVFFTTSPTWEAC